MNMKVERVDIPETGIHSGMKIGWACPRCRKLIEAQPDPHAPICSKHRVAYHRVIYIEERVDDKMQIAFLRLDIFNSEQLSVIETIIRKVNNAFEWILTHEHAYQTTIAAFPGEEEE